MHSIERKQEQFKEMQTKLQHHARNKELSTIQ